MNGAMNKPAESSKLKWISGGLQVYILQSGQFEDKANHLQ